MITIKRQDGNAKGTRFVVNIRYRENATWQGEVLWVDQKRQCNFRSALELLKLMDGVLINKEMKEDSDTKQD